MSALRVTFDTNTLEKVTRPERYPKDPNRDLFDKVNAWIIEQKLLGFFSASVATLEGIQKSDRSEVYGSSVLTSKKERFGDVTTINLKFEMPKAKSLHREQVARLEAALALGLKILRCPRIGMRNIEDIEDKFHFIPKDSAALAEYLSRFAIIGHALEQRGVGFALVKKLADMFALRAKVLEPFYVSLGRAKDIHERNEVSRAIAEWSDADSISAHYAAGNDFFCTGDFGKSSNTRSVLDADNRFWLSDNFGVKFATISQLGQMLVQA